jgi:hypothetical protein
MNITSAFFPFYKKFGNALKVCPTILKYYYGLLCILKKKSVLPEKKKALLTTYLRSRINLKIPFMLKINLNKTNSV